MSDSRNDLEFLLTLDIEKLFDKYEKISRPNHLDRMKIEEITETLNDVKTKLQLQVEQRTSHEKLHGEIMDILSIPEGNRFLSSILPAIVCLKESLDQNEVDLYANAEAVLDS